MKKIIPVALLVISVITIYFSINGSKMEQIESEHSFISEEKKGHPPVTKDNSITALTTTSNLQSTVTDNVESQSPEPEHSNIAHDNTVAQKERPPSLDSEREKLRKKAIRASTDAAFSKDWDTFLDAASKIDSKAHYRLDTTISAAIRNDAPINVFYELLQLGATFKPHHTTELSVLNKLELTKKLIPLGLDIHATNLSGDNGLNSILKVFWAKDMFTFLLESGVDSKPGDSGEDNLTIALKGTLTTPEAIFFVQQLIRYGEEINSHHLDLIKRIKQKKPSHYLQLQRNVPELDL